jgi:hypothetical protein
MFIKLKKHTVNIQFQMNLCLYNSNFQIESEGILQLRKEVVCPSL